MYHLVNLNILTSDQLSKYLTLNTTNKSHNLFILSFKVTCRKNFFLLSMSIQPEVILLCKKNIHKLNIKNLHLVSQMTLPCKVLILGNTV